MAAETASKIGEVPCPDPSVHSKTTQLQDQASAAALYSTRPSRNKDVNPLGPDGKLSSAGAATSLKYARAQDLPGFPTVGIDTQNSGLSAATLASNNKTNVERWKPGKSEAASTAALLAKDYKMAPLWQPEPSAAGSKAALLAHKDGGKLNIWMPEASKDGNSAAGLAMRNKSLSPQIDYGYTDDGRKKALLAATASLQGNRRRSGSTPVPMSTYPDQANSAHNALNAAIMAHRPSTKSPPQDANQYDSAAMQASRVKNLGQNVSRDMFTEHPPVALEVEEKKHQDALRASAISMAKKMYDVQASRNDDAGNPITTEGRTGATRAHRDQRPSSSQADVRQQAMQYLNLQEAAQKLVVERLAKIAPDEATVYRNYYGYPSQRRSRLSIRGRRRASSEGEVVVADSDDEEQSRRIRSQMSQFNTQLAQVDARKQQRDRENLLAVAERRVHARMHDMDEKVFLETGKPSQAMMDEWDVKARERAQADSDVRMQNHGKVHIGGGKFMDQVEVDRIAALRIQPTLDEVNEKAETQRAKDEEMRLDEEEKKRQAIVEKEREKELRAEQKRAKREEKAMAKTAKNAEKTRRSKEKRTQKEASRRSKEEKRKSKETEKIEKAAGAAGAADQHQISAEDAGHPSPTLSKTMSYPEQGVGTGVTSPSERPNILRQITNVETSSSSSAGEAASLSSISAYSEGEAEPTADDEHQNSEVAASPMVAHHVVTAPAATSASSAVEPEVSRPVTTDEDTTAQPSTLREKESRLKGLLSRFKSKRKGKASTNPAEKPVDLSSPQAVEATEEIDKEESANISPSVGDPTSTSTAVAPGAGTQEHLSSPSISSLSSSDTEAVRQLSSRKGRTRADVSDDEFEEARDTFDAGAVTTPSAGFSSQDESVGRGRGRFREAL